MRSPSAAFDLRAALTKEIRSALEQVSTPHTSARAVHACRLHLKRARALAKVGRVGAPGLASVFNESARGVMHELAAARELAALAQCAHRNAERCKCKKAAAALQSVAHAMEAIRATTPAPDLGSVQAGLRDLLAMAQVWPEASVRQIERGAERIVRRARRAFRRSVGSAQAGDRHTWRKREKDRLYAATLLGPNWPDGRKRRRKRGQLLGDLLGRERDTLILIERLEHEPGLAGGAVAAERARAALRQSLRRVARRADAAGVQVHAEGA